MTEKRNLDEAVAVSKRIEGLAKRIINSIEGTGALTRPEAIWQVTVFLAVTEKFRTSMEKVYGEFSTQEIARAYDVFGPIVEDLFDDMLVGVSSTYQRGEPK